ncbi:hypothetical protein SNE40_003630 [Patella caerulea]|uniref:Uncharacterized protein n=1 Tax=Patella caerulea TaxID=87958 RepID=A0AAN8KEK4_PATCE
MADSENTENAQPTESENPTGETELVNTPEDVGVENTTEGVVAESTPETETPAAETGVEKTSEEERQAEKTSEETQAEKMEAETQVEKTEEAGAGTEETVDTTTTIVVTKAESIEEAGDEPVAKSTENAKEEKADIGQPSNGKYLNSTKTIYTILEPKQKRNTMNNG